MTLTTPLYQHHLDLGAKMVHFHNWSMPLHYGSQLQEHKIVRTDAGMFDVSHMTILDLLGSDARRFLRTLLTQDIDNLPHPGHAFYSCMCNEQGGIIDDLIVYPLGPDHFRLVLNAVAKNNDLAWLQQQVQGYAVTLQERQDLSIIAVQGPQAIQKIMPLFPHKQAKSISSLSPFECVQLDDFFVARTGYTGEDGLEFMAAPDDMTLLWEKLIHCGIKPCGLGARDTLRIEAGLLLYGQDMNETTSPLESGLKWTVNWDDPNRDFIGRSALVLQQQNLQKKLIGLQLHGQGVMRSDQKVIIKALPNGVITSGSFSPNLDQSIGFARVPYLAQGEVWVEVRGKLLSAEICKLRFIKQGNIL